MNNSKEYPYSFLQAWHEDMHVNKGNSKAKLVLTLFRVTNFFAAMRFKNKIIYLIGIPFLISYRVLVEWILGIELPSCTVVGPGLELHHGQGLVVNGNTIIGEHCIIRHNTTIGCVRLSDGSQGQSPVIGADVEIGANVVILGGIKIGNGAKIGAGSVVIREVPDNATVVGNPARVIRS